MLKQGLLFSNRRRIPWTWVCAAVLIVASALDHAGAFGYRPGDRTRYDGAIATVTNAVDGDTLDVDIPDGERAVTRVRLWGVDAPEIAQRDGESDAHFGPEAAAFVREHVVGRRVEIRFDPNRRPRDRYGRLFAYLYLVDRDSGESDSGGTATDPAAEPVMLNELLVEKGLAYADRRVDHIFKVRFAQVEQSALRRRAGLWANVTPEKMPDWRRRMGREEASDPGASPTNTGGS